MGVWVVDAPLSRGSLFLETSEVWRVPLAKAVGGALLYGGAMAIIPRLFLELVPLQVTCLACSRGPRPDECYGPFPENWDQIMGICADCSEDSEGSIH